MISESTSEAVNGGIVTSDQSIKTFRFVWRPFSLIPFLEFAVRHIAAPAGGGFHLSLDTTEMAEASFGESAQFNNVAAICSKGLRDLYTTHFTGHHIRIDENRPRARASRS